MASLQFAGDVPELPALLEGPWAGRATAIAFSIGENALQRRQPASKAVLSTATHLLMRMCFMESVTAVWAPVGI